MNKRFLHLTILFFILAGMITLGVVRPAAAGVRPQATAIAPTVTPLSSGPMVMVNPGQNEQFIKVRSGPHVLFAQIGILSVGQKAPAKGITAGGDWILIEYPGVPGSEGWVYSGFVSLTPGDLPIVEPPSTPTPQVTQTIDPTLAAQFIVTIEPSRMPTFTPAAPITIPTYTSSSGGIPGVPMGLIIIVLLVLGVVTGLISFLTNR